MEFVLLDLWAHPGISLPRVLSHLLPFSPVLRRAPRPLPLPISAGDGGLAAALPEGVLLPCVCSGPRATGGACGLTPRCSVPGWCPAPPACRLLLWARPAAPWSSRPLGGPSSSQMLCSSLHVPVVLPAKGKFRPPLPDPTLLRGGEHLAMVKEPALTTQVLAAPLAAGSWVSYLPAGPGPLSWEGFSRHPPLRLRRLSEAESEPLVQSLALKPVQKPVAGGAVGIHPCPLAASLFSGN